MGTNLRGKVVVVTGGNSASASAWPGLREGGRRHRRLEPARGATPGLRKLAKHGVRAVGVVCDVGEEASIVSATKDTLAALGRIDACVASAGAPGYSKSLVDTTIEDWRAVTRVSFDGLFLTFRECVRAMIARGEGGALVAVSSTSAIHGAQRNHAYAASKTGLLGLTRALAVELARHKIRVNAILPGWTITEMAMGGYQNEKSAIPPPRARRAPFGASAVRSSRATLISAHLPPGPARRGWQLHDLLITPRAREPP
jgi:NAD(P)-dependent dehydrogenase (short-subunit alcohol dehydrogenase family)